MSMAVPGARLFTNEISMAFRFHCAVKLNTGFSSSPRQASFLGVWSKTTNLPCLLMPLPTAGLAC